MAVFNVSQTEVRLDRVPAVSCLTMFLFLTMGNVGAWHADPDKSIVGSDDSLFISIDTLLYLYTFSIMWTNVDNVPDEVIKCQIHFPDSI